MNTLQLHAALIDCDNNCVSILLSPAECCSYVSRSVVCSDGHVVFPDSCVPLLSSDWLTQSLSPDIIYQSGARDHQASLQFLMRKIKHTVTT